MLFRIVLSNYQYSRTSEVPFVSTENQYCLVQIGEFLKCKTQKSQCKSQENSTSWCYSN